MFGHYIRLQISKMEIDPGEEVGEDCRSFLPHRVNNCSEEAGGGNVEDYNRYQLLEMGGAASRDEEEETVFKRSGTVGKSTFYA